MVLLPMLAFPYSFLLPVGSCGGRRGQFRIKTRAHPNEGTVVRIEAGYH